MNKTVYAPATIGENIDERHHAQEIFLGAMIQGMVRNDDMRGGSILLIQVPTTIKEPQVCRNDCVH